MKRQAGGAPGGDPEDAMDVMGGRAATGAGPTSYASADAELGGVELLEDRTIRISGGRHGRRLGVSVPGAIAGSFLVAALALGAALGPLAGTPASDAGNNAETAVSEPTDKTDATTDGEQPDKTDGGDEPKVGDGDGTDGEGPDGGEEPEKTDAPEAPDKPEPTEEPAPDALAIEIGLAIEGTSVVIEWSACETDGFAYYKIIRSKDEFATWPLGAGDSLAAAIEDQGVTRFVDKAVDGGRTYHYKVVALRLWEGEKVVACRSDVKSIATPTPPKPDPTDGGEGEMAIAVTIKEGHPFIDWTACEGVDFDYYKLVRSTDSTVTWPKGENDSLVTAIGADGETKAWDGDAPGGKKIFYRVFCVRSSEAGYDAVASSAVKGIETPAGEPAPDPKGLGFEANVTAEGVVLNWQACGVDNFTYYKVVRSTTTENPSYFPWTDGTELIAVIDNQDATQFVDSNVESGQTVYYRVQCLGYWNGEKVLRGQTAVIAVTIP